jgi:hypothetical protein
MKAPTASDFIKSAKSARYTHECVKPRNLIAAAARGS